MTAHASFKKRIRERMAKTGERYGAARRSLIERSERHEHRNWAAPPEQPDESVVEHTGKTWNEWCDIIDTWPESAEGHSAVAARVGEDFDIGGWWSQAVTVGWERITGRRLVNQMSDGSFTAAVSRTLTIDAGELRQMLYDDVDRGDLFGGMSSELRSRDGVRVIRLKLDVGTVGISIEGRSDGRTRVGVSHTRLADSADVTRWKSFWTEWLEALDDG